MAENQMEPKDRADLYFKLAQSAQDRFDSRRDVEWKVAIALWTLFGAAAGAIITARYWTPSPWQVVCISASVIGILYIYRRWWLTYLAEAFARDQRTSYYWESAIQELLGVELPRGLDPKWKDANGRLTDRLDWIRKSTYEGSVPACDQTFDRSLRESQQCQFLMAVAFGALLIFVTAGRYIDAPPPSKQEGSSVGQGQPTPSPNRVYWLGVGTTGPMVNAEPDLKTP